jgi:hypothetical protein
MFRPGMVLALIERFGENRNRSADMIDADTAVVDSPPQSE